MGRKSKSHFKTGCVKLKFWVSTLVLTVAGSLLGAACASASKQPVLIQQDGISFSLKRAVVTDGSVLFVEVKPVTKSVAGEFYARWGGMDVLLSEEQGAYIGMVGIPHSTPSGKQELEILEKVPVEAQAKRVSLIPFEIVSGNYAEETLSVQPEKVNPPPQAMKRIARETKLVNAVYARSDSKKYWSRDWRLPIVSDITSRYGNKRLYNGEMRNFHPGVDLRAPVGTPIRAPTGAIVKLSKNLYFTGNTVILDHGQGVFSVYAHLSKIKVKKGQFVKSGQLLGLSGMTGRVSGPHLHWGVQVHRVKVDPIEVVETLKPGSPL